MIDVLQYFGYGDWQLCSLACQVLWNFCASAADVQSTLGDKETEKLVFVLEEFLGKDFPRNIVYYDSGKCAILNH